MNCNIFVSCFNSYSITQEGKIYSKYENKYLTIETKEGFHEVLYSFGSGKERFTLWFRVDWLVAMRYIPNPNGYNFIKHLDGNNLNDNVSNLQWLQYCVDAPCKEIANYRGKYIITNDGRVFNNYTGTLMKSRLILGYPHVGLRVFENGISELKLFKIHRLVAEYFIPNPNNYPIVNHINGNKLDARVENLEWTTYQGNTNHAIKTGLLKHSWTKELAWIAITLIELYDYSSQDVADLLNKNVSTVKYLYQTGYKNLGLHTNNQFVRKNSRYIPKKELPEYYKKYIIDVLKDNTVLNLEIKKS